MLLKRQKKKRYYQVSVPVKVVPQTGATKKKGTLFLIVTSLGWGEHTKHDVMNLIDPFLRFRN